MSYQIVIEEGHYGPEYKVYEARDTGTGTLEIAPQPVEIIGNSIGEIDDMLRSIQQDIAGQEPVLKEDCNIFHDTMWLDDDDILLDEDFDDIELQEWQRLL